MTEVSGSVAYVPNPARQTWQALIGQWDTLGKHPGFPSPVKGHAAFEWFEPAALLVWHSDWERPGPPSATSVIGHDDSDEVYSMLYSDERGVTRIYKTSVEGNVWKLWRDAPEFSQRVTGLISHDGNTITAHGELSRDGSTWERDLDVTYTRAAR